MATTIMIVDDSSMIRMTVSRALKDAEYEIIEAEDGEKALAIIQQQPKISLIISDINMPKMDGLTFVSHVKSVPQYKFLPVIMLTTETKPELIQKGKEVGVKAWMVKPFDKEQLIGAIKKLIM